MQFASAIQLFSKRAIHAFSVRRARIDSMASPTYQSLPRAPRTKSLLNILALDACRANIVRSKEASFGMALLSPRPDIHPVCKALPAELMVTLRAYPEYSAIGALE
jgi:hypothetical protein